MQTAMEKDMAEIKENGDYEYIDNEVDTSTELIQEQPVEVKQEETQQNKVETEKNTDFFFGNN